VVARHRVGQEEVLVVHRPQYDDWTFPKGKRVAGETDQECALREVEEETGLRCRLGRELETVSYIDRRGRKKSVRYWEMAPLGGTFAPGPEVDEVRWLTPEDARRTLTYAHDRDLLQNSRDRERGGVA
jgi:8-oxo-dGTP diphosphatase